MNNAFYLGLLSLISLHSIESASDSFSSLKQFTKQFLQQAYDLPLPTSFRVFDRITLRHIKSVTQEGPSCGWFALCNASAVDQLEKNMDSITAATIEPIVKNKMNTLQNHQSELMKWGCTTPFFEGLMLPEVYRLSEYIELSRCYFLHLFPQKRWLQWYAPSLLPEWESYLDTEKIYEHTYGVSSPQLFLKKLLSSKTITHFYIALPVSFDLSRFHAVLVTILWHEDILKPTVIYMDSNNALLGNQGNEIITVALYLFLKTINESLESI